MELEELNFPLETQFQFRCLIFNEVMEVSCCCCCCCCCCDCYFYFLWYERIIFLIFFFKSILSLIQKLDLRYHIKSHLDEKDTKEGKVKAKGKGKTTKTTKKSK